MKKLLLSILAIAAIAVVADNASIPGGSLIPQTTDGGYELQTKMAYTLGMMYVPRDTITVVSQVLATNTTDIITSTNIYHTFHCISTNTTTNIFVTFSRSLDGVNFVPFATNNITSDTTTETTATGAFVYMRARTVSTNGAVKVLYFGRRP